MRYFAIALNIALGIVLVAWLHNPPLDYQRPAKQPQYTSTSPEQPSGEQTQPSPSSATTQFPPPKELQIDRATDSRDGDRKPEKGWWDKLWTDPNATFAGLVGVFTVLLTGVSAWQAKIAHSQAELTKALQRAHLWVEIGSIRSLTNEPGFVPRIVIRNAGHMPAKSVGWIFGEPKFTADNQWKPPADGLGEPTGEITLAPGAAMTHGAQTLLMRQDEFPPKTYLYVWGCVRYHDGFEGGRITQFCHRYSLDRMWWDKEGMGLRVFAKQHSRYNRYYNDAI